MITHHLSLNHSLKQKETKARVLLYLMLFPLNTNTHLTKITSSEIQLGCPSSIPRTQMTELKGTQDMQGLAVRTLVVEIARTNS